MQEKKKKKINFNTMLVLPPGISFTIMSRTKLMMRLVFSTICMPADQRSQGGRFRRFWLPFLGRYAIPTHNSDSSNAHDAAENEGKYATSREPEMALANVNHLGIPLPYTYPSGSRGGGAFWPVKSNKL